MIEINAVEDEVTSLHFFCPVIESRKTRHLLFYEVNHRDHTLTGTALVRRLQAALRKDFDAEESEWRKRSIFDICDAPITVRPDLEMNRNRAVPIFEIGRKLWITAGSWLAVRSDNDPPGSAALRLHGAGTDFQPGPNQARYCDRDIFRDAATKRI